MSQITLRAGKIQDSNSCGQICYDAFQAIADQHNFPSEFPQLQPTMDIIASMLSNHGFYSVIAEHEGKIIGSNFLDERGDIVGVGPISIAPAVQNTGVGRQLMQHVIDRALSLDRPGIRLNTAAHHGRSLSLYSKIGFKTRAPIVIIQGSCAQKTIKNTSVRQAQLADLDATTQLCESIHGCHRKQEVSEAITQGTAKIVERAGQITGYSTEVSFFGHAVAKTNDDMKALIAATSEYKGAGFLLPTTNYDLLIWCLENGLKIVMSMVYMTIGLYNEPQGVYLPSILY